MHRAAAHAYDREPAKKKARIVTTNKEVAQWMLDQIMERNHLYRWHCVQQIEKTFGTGFTEEGDHGVRVIKRQVMTAFNRLPESKKVKYSQAARRWDKL